ncbi:MAG: rod shape-determining protein MreD [Acidimicrobiia bacterium]|nr:rod shape-determining protein MreD [Acidimicrobiia bacterium]MCY4458428.1 rod shape-determining protein MreD [Acidimicrobiaceae bacterium]
MTVLRLALLILVALVVQVTVFVDLRFWGVAPELLVLLAVLVGYLAGPRTGPTIAFVIGLLWDVYLPSPLGLSAIVFALVAYVVAAGGAELFSDSKAQLVIIVALGTVGALAGYALLGEVMGQRGLVDMEMLRVAVVAALLNMVLTPLVRPLMVWAIRPRLATG